MEITTVSSLPVEYLLRNLVDSVDAACPDEYCFCFWTKRCANYTFDLPALLNRKFHDYCTPALLERILHEGFIVPICVLDRPQGFILGNGNHRFSLAIALCLDSIPTVITNGNDYMQSDLTGDTGASHRPLTDSWDDYDRIEQEWAGIFNPIHF